MCNVWHGITSTGMYYVTPQRTSLHNASQNSKYKSSQVMRQLCSTTSVSTLEHGLHNNGDDMRISRLLLMTAGLCNNKKGENETLLRLCLCAAVHLQGSLVSHRASTQKTMRTAGCTPKRNRWPWCRCKCCCACRMCHQMCYLPEAGHTCKHMHPTSPHSWHPSIVYDTMKGVLNLFVCARLACLCRPRNNLRQSTLVLHCSDYTCARLQLRFTIFKSDINKTNGKSQYLLLCFMCAMGYPCTVAASYHTTTTRPRLSVILLYTE